MNRLKRPDWAFKAIWNPFTYEIGPFTLIRRIEVGENDHRRYPFYRYEQLPMKKPSTLRAKKKFLRLGGSFTQSGKIFEFTSRYTSRLPHMDNTFAGVIFTEDLYRHANLSFAIQEALRVSHGQVWIVTRISQKGLRGRLGNALEVVSRKVSALLAPLADRLGMKTLPMTIHLSEAELISAVERAGGRIIFSDYMGQFTTRKKYCIGSDQINRQQVAHKHSEMKAA